jgi:hypothetical protein
MTELKAIMIRKNLRVQDVVEITGYGNRMVEKFMAGEKETPKVFMDAVTLEPDRESHGIMRRAFISLLSELGLTYQQASTILGKHVDRIKRMADIKMDQDRRVAINEVDIAKLRKHGKK